MLSKNIKKKNTVGKNFSPKQKQGKTVKKWA
jgi:hypothetical protein